MKIDAALEVCRRAWKKCIVSGSPNKEGTYTCPRCSKAPMNEVLRIAPIQEEPGLVAYECPSCNYVTSVLLPPAGATSSNPKSPGVKRRTEEDWGR
jgi:transposase-like protein